MTMDSLRRLALLAALTALTLGSGAGALAHEKAEPKKAAQPIQNTVLAAGMPNDAPGMVLQLERYEFAPGAEIPMHVHPGAYVISVQSGQFGFTVVKGEAILTRAGTTTPERIAAGAEVVARAGDAIFENGGVIHSARNAGDTPVVVLTAALLEAREPSLQPTNKDGMPVS